MILCLPGVKKILPNKTGGTVESRYCYSVWMRHLKKWNIFNDKVPEKVAELGPGDSLGIGLAALLSGSKHLYAFDVVKYWDNKKNLTIFEELVKLYKSKVSIPDDLEYPKIKPKLIDYNFPANILSEKLLKQTLSEKRLDLIRKEILDINNPKNIFIKYYIPWDDSDILDKETVDFIYSQAVLEHVEDLESTYYAMRKWLKPSGLMSHTIDFKSHAITKSWNGHWTFSNFEWKIVKCGRIFLINRQSFSKHLELHSKFGFKILLNIPSKLENKLPLNKISSEFKNLSNEDITTSGAYILSKKI